MVQLLSRVQLFGTQKTAAHQASRSLTISQGLLKLTTIESVHLNLWPYVNVQKHQDCVRCAQKLSLKASPVQ